MNHHFWGDVSAWFYTYLAGIRVNPERDDCSHIDIKPCFPDGVSDVRAYHICPAGKISVEWQRDGDTVLLMVGKAYGIHGKVCASDGYVFDGGEKEKELASAEYILHREQIR